MGAAAAGTQCLGQGHCPAPMVIPGQGHFAPVVIPGQGHCPAPLAIPVHRAKGSHPCCWTSPCARSAHGLLSHRPPADSVPCSFEGKTTTSFWPLDSSHLPCRFPPPPHPSCKLGPGTCPCLFSYLVWMKKPLWECESEHECS